MTYLDSNLEIIGKILAITALTVAVFITYLSRHYSRSLYFAQLLYICSILYTTSLTFSFSFNLSYSWISFMPSFADKWCSGNDFSCTYGYLISPGVSWLGGALFFFLLIKIVACKKKNAKFLSFYNLYKGIMYWFFPPLVFFSTGVIIVSLQDNNMNNDFTAAIIVVAVFAAIAIIQVICYKTAQGQNQNVWKKWIEFFSHCAIGSVMALAALSLKVSEICKYLINIPLVLFTIIYLVKYKFTFKVFERVIVLIQDAVIIACFNIFILKYEYITSYAIDFYALCVVIFLEILEMIIKIKVMCKRADDDDEEEGDDRSGVVSPEKEGRSVDRADKLKNSFANINDLNPENSFDIMRNNSGIRQNNPSPRRSPPKRR